ncbi:SH3 domain-containing protein [Stenotrophomonas sp. Iso1]|uniref:XAC2610-related protein n=1 Tax=Stenotrophomonas sp. Iso1 TaxID=2977283 RepID=UPI0022B78B46|nr:SH3 domain-containing protein [Stenotrophomonas sp. Iso1]
MTQLNFLRHAARCLLLAGMALLPLGALATDDSDIRFDVSPGVTAHARLLEDGRIEVGTTRSAHRQQLQAASDEEGHSRLGHADYNFDGYQDLDSSATLGQVNESVVVYLYEPASGAFRALAPPSGANLNCDGFWSLQPDATTRTLTSSCRSGPMWYTDIYRYNGPTLYLFRTMRTAFVDTELLARVLAVDASEDMDVPAVWSTHDPAGKMLEHAISNGLEAPDSNAPLKGRIASVVPVRLPLYSRSGDATTKRYLVKGDKVELLDAADGWLQVRYQNPARDPILGWVKLPEQP